MQSLADGTQLGAYKIVRLIGRGGMGEVYEAYEERLDRRVALKVIAPQKAGVHGEVDLVRRFLQEARTLAQVNHPNVVTIYAIDNINETQFIAMEYVDGILLKDLFALYALSADEATPIFIQLLEGLRSLHDNRILHRDLKPHNLIIRPDGQIKILDFGIAKRLGDRNREATTIGVVVGTLAYLPPEVLHGAPATLQSDLWSLGAIFYECLVGQPLVTVSSQMMQGVRAFEHSDVVFPQECLRWVPEEMRKIVGRLCDRRPSERYATAADAIEALKIFQQGRPPVSPQIWKALLRVIEGSRAAINLLNPKEVRGTKEKREQFLAALNLPGSNEPAVAVDESTKSRGQSSERVYTQVVRDSISARNRARRYRRGFPIPRPWAVGLVVGSLALALGLHLFFAGKTTSVAKRPDISTPAPTAAAALTLTQPTENQALWLDSTQTPTLAWSQLLAAGEYELQISADADFHSLVAREKVVGNSLNLSHPLAEGTYSWQLVATKARGTVIGPAHFSVSNLAPVDLLWPSVDQSFEILRFSKFYDLGFGWRCKPGAVKYRAQISADAAFTILVKDQVVGSCSWSQVQLPIGNYVWRVRIEDPAAARATWSAARSFVIRSVARTAPLAAVTAAPPVQEVSESEPFDEKPRAAERRSRGVANLSNGFERLEPKLKNSNVKMTLKFNDRNVGRDVASAHKQLVESPVFDWNSVKGARSYRVQIAWNSDFTKLLSEDTVAQPSYQWKEVMPGRMYWRVRAVNASGQQSAYSRSGSVEAMVPAPALNASYSLNEQKVFEWPPVPLVEKYIVQTSPRRSMASATEKIVARAQVPIDAKGPGPVFVRVAAASASGERVSEFSNVASIAPEADTNPLVPQLLTPRRGARARVGPSGRVSVIFSWAKIEAATNYQIEVATDPDFIKIIEQKSLKTHHSVMREAQLSGQIYWRVRAEYAHGISDWSTVGTFEVQ